MLSIIVAVSENDVIGSSHHLGLLWRLPSELAYFRQVTKGKTLIMGRKTWDSLPNKPLKGRPCIILSRQSFAPPFPDARVITHLEDILHLPGDPFVIGGGEVYALLLPFCERIFLTRIHKHVVGDIFFPRLSPYEWHLESQSPTPLQHEGDEASYTTQIYHRITPKGGA